MGPIPYLHFRGDCAEAMAFYAEVFGAPAPEIRRSSEAPEDVGMPRDDRVLHAVLRLGDGVLMASDYPSDVEGHPQSGVSIVYSAPDFEAGRRVFARLGEGGAELMGFGPTFWSQGFGMVRDRFGTHWMVDVPEGAA